MTNEEKYKTVEERVKAFRNHCNPIVGNCGTRCRLSEPDKSGGYDMLNCFAYWLTLEAEEEKPMPCPFCGAKCEVIGAINHRVKCSECNYESTMDSDREKVIAAHNRVCRAVKAYKESEVAE